MTDTHATQFGNPSLSLMARGLLAHLYAIGATTFSLADLMCAEAGGVGRDRAIRLAAELRAAGLISRTRGGFTLSSPSVHPVNCLNNSVFPVKSDFQENTELQQHAYRSSTGEICSVVAMPDFPENTELLKSGSETITQPALVGLPEHPSPAKPKRPRNPPAPPEVRAIYPALFTLTKSPPKGKRAQGVYVIARNLWRDYTATPEQVAAFWDWFKLFSTAAQQAARERRDLNAPMPRQVYEFWPQFLPWWEAKLVADARERARRAAEATVPAQPARGASAVGIHPFRRPALPPSAAPPTAMVAAGRTT